MNEQRAQAYLSLIQELLTCPSGEENDVLNQFSELVDEGFVQVCEQEAAKFQEAGQDDAAEFLRDVAQQVAAFLRRSEIPQSGRTAMLGQFINADTWNDSQAFLQAHPELLDEETDILLEQLVNLADGEEREQRILQEHRELLQRCRVVGIEQAFAEKRAEIRAARLQEAMAEVPEELAEELAQLPPEMGDLIQDIFSALQESGTAPDDLEALLRSSPELMGRLADMAMGASGLGNLLNAENSGDALTQFWGQLLQAEMEGDTAAVHQVMRQNMGLIVPALGDTIVQWVQGFLAQNPGKAEGVAALVENTCISIQEFPSGRYAEAQEIAIRGYDVVLQLRADNPSKRAQTLNNLGVARDTQAEMGIEPAQNLQKAIEAYNEAAEIRRQRGLEKDLSSTLNNLGVARRTQAEMGIEPAQNLQKAIEAYNEAAEIRRQPGLEKDLSSTLNNLGSARVTQAEMGIEPAQNLQKAITAYNEAAEILRQPGLEKDLSSTLNNLGNARLTQARMGIEPAQNLQKAITAYNEAAEILRQPGLEKDLSTTLNNLGSARVTQAEMGIDPAGNLQKAITAYNEAAEILRQPGLEKDLSTTLNNLGNARSTQAEMGIEPAGNLQKAIEAYNDAAEILRQPGLEKDLSTTLNNLGVARKTQAQMGIDPAGNLEAAITAYNDAAEIRRQLGLARDLAKTLSNFGFAYQAQSRLAGNSSDEKQQALDNAYRSFQEALEQVEYLRGEIGADSEGYKRNFNEEWNRVYRGMVEVCLELGRYQDAIEYADRSKARNLVELMATRDAYPEGVIPDDIRQRLQQLRQAISAENRRLQQEEKQEKPDYTHLDQLRQEFREKFPYQPLHFQAMQKLLDEETAILEWYILGNKFLTFTLTPDPPLAPPCQGGEQETPVISAVSEPSQGGESEPPLSRGAGGIQLWTSSEEDLTQLIDWTRNYLTDYYINKDQWRDSLAERLEQLPKILHLDEILQNLRKKFPKCQKLILIPHRYLHLFPLHALPVSDPQKGERRSPLQELFPKGVTYAPNCQLLQQAQNRPRFNFKRLFAIQNPTEDLGWADVEVETIRTLFPNRDILEAEEATTAKLLDNQRQEILRQTHHLFFSCHAAFNPNSPLDSGLLLADGILTLENIIAKLNLSNCSLVTLSACETGQVALDQTDEYISLSSGFILAGSPSVLVSLWSVNQVSTALLLIKTYELLQQQPGQLAQALQGAQKWLRETTNAGFSDWVQKCRLLNDYWRKQLAKVFQNRQNKEGADFPPYQSPYHWAAFCIVGEGEQVMASDAKKITAFTALVQENLNNWIAHHGESLLELRQQLGDDDEKNAAAIEGWLQQRQDLYDQYTAKLAPRKRDLSLSGEKGAFGTKPTKPDNSLADQIEQAVKNNTNLDNSDHSSEQNREKPQS